MDLIYYRNFLEKYTGWQLILGLHGSQPNIVLLAAYLRYILVSYCLHTSILMASYLTPTDLEQDFKKNKLINDLEG
jgi:hypothetical protein